MMNTILYEDIIYQSHTTVIGRVFCMYDAHIDCVEATMKCVCE